MKRVMTIATIAAALTVFSGCAGKKSLLVPGQSESDCDAKAQKLGVCGTPKSIYEHRDAIKHIYFEEDEAYRVSKNGKVYNIESGEEVIPGVKPDGCGLAVCPGCDDDEAEGAAGKSGSGYKGSKKHAVRLQSRAMVLETPHAQTPVRDLGLIQKVWIAPHENRAGDLVMAHELLVVVRKPSWIVGEPKPKRTRNGAVVPTPVAEQLFTDSHDAIRRSDIRSLEAYSNEEGPDMSKIEAYLDEQKKKAAPAPYKPLKSGETNENQ